MPTLPADLLPEIAFSDGGTRASSQKEKRMSKDTKSVAIARQRGLSLDGWAVLLAFLAALLVRAGIFRHIPW